MTTSQILPLNTQSLESNDDASQDFSEDVIETQTSQSADTFEQEFDLACEEIEKRKANDFSDSSADFQNVTNSSTLKNNTPDQPDTNTSSKNSETELPDEDEDEEETTQETKEASSSSSSSRGDSDNSELGRIKAYYEQQLALANSRLQSVASEYQKTKAKLLSSGQGTNSQQQALNKNNELDELFAGSKLPSLDEAKKIIENDPEYAGAILRILNSKIEDVKGSTLNEVKSQIYPVYRQMQMSQAEKSFQAIRQAHPDTDEILQSGELHKWIASLPPMYRMGAERVFQKGTAEESIALLTEFKNNTSYTNPKVDRTQNATHSKKQQTTSPNGVSSTKSTSEKRKESEELVSRLRDGLAVSSGRLEPSLTQPQKIVSFEDEFNAAVDAIEARHRASVSRNVRR